MARQYYFKHWNEARLLIEHLECFEVPYDVECGINVVDEGYDNLVTVLDEDGESFAEHFAKYLRDYPYERYEADRARAIAEGEDPRLIMSYFGTLSYMAWEAEKEREWEEAEAYDEEWDEDDVRQMREAYAELEREEAEREIAAEVAERDEIIEFVEFVETAARDELAAFGNIAADTALSDAEWNETSNEFWEFVCDLWGEPKSYVLTELF